jgi:PIN domain nuclease of toxin-antitoxin system
MHIQRIKFTTVVKPTHVNLNANIAIKNAGKVYSSSISNITADSKNAHKNVSFVIKIVTAWPITITVRLKLLQYTNKINQLKRDFTYALLRTLAKIYVITLVSAQIAMRKKMVSGRTKMVY